MGKDEAALPSDALPQPCSLPYPPGSHMRSHGPLRQALILICLRPPLHGPVRGCCCTVPCTVPSAYPESRNCEPFTLPSAYLETQTCAQSPSPPSSPPPSRTPSSRLGDRARVPPSTSDALFSTKRHLRPRCLISQPKPSFAPNWRRSKTLPHPGTMVTCSRLPRLNDGDPNQHELSSAPTDVVSSTSDPHRPMRTTSSHTSSAAHNSPPTPSPPIVVKSSTRSNWGETINP